MTRDHAKDGAAASTSQGEDSRPPLSPPEIIAAADIMDRLFFDPTLWQDSATVGRALARTPVADPAAAAANARKRGLIVGTWDGHARRYPAFQFDAEGQPLPKLGELFEHSTYDRTGHCHDVVLWLFAPDAALEGRSIAETFPHNPDRVLALHRRRLGLTDDGD